MAMSCEMSRAMRRDYFVSLVPPLERDHFSKCHSLPESFSSHQHQSGVSVFLTPMLLIRGCFVEPVFTAASAVDGTARCAHHHCNICKQRTRSSAATSNMALTHNLSAKDIYSIRWPYTTRNYLTCPVSTRNA